MAHKLTEELAAKAKDPENPTPEIIEGLIAEIRTGLAGKGLPWVSDILDELERLLRSLDQEVETYTKTNEMMLERNLAMVRALLGTKHLPLLSPDEEVMLCTAMRQVSGLNTRKMDRPGAWYELIEDGRVLEALEQPMFKEIQQLERQLEIMTACRDEGNRAFVKLRTESWGTIQGLQARVQKVLPQVETCLDKPADPKGMWFLDIQYGGHEIVVQWKPVHAFGISIGPKQYGEGVDEVYPNLDEAFDRIIQVLAQPRPMLEEYETICDTCGKNAVIGHTTCAQCLLSESS